MSNYDRYDRQDETAMWDAEEIRRQESQQRRRQRRRRPRVSTRTVVYLSCVVLVSCLLPDLPTSALHF